MQGRTLVLLRHGRTAWNVAGRAQGHADVPLDEVGRAQAEAVAPVLSKLGPVAIWSSDLSRAAQTAAVVAQAAGLQPVIDPRLREYAVGPHRTGLTLAEYAERFPEEHAALQAGRIAEIPGREEHQELLDRMLPALTSYGAALGPGETGIVVSHGAALRTAVAAFLGWPREAGLTLGVLDNCGWVVLDHSAPTWDAGPSRWRLRAWNRAVA